MLRKVSGITVGSDLPVLWPPGQVAWQEAGAGQGGWYLAHRKSCLPGSSLQLLLTLHGSDKQGDVLRATSLTQRVWELRYSLPGEGGRQGGDKART